MNKELVLEQIDACILMLEQIKSSITGAGDGTPKRFWVDSDGVQHFEKDPYLLDGDIFCCGEIIQRQKMNVEDLLGTQIMAELLLVNL